MRPPDESHSCQITRPFQHVWIIYWTPPHWSSTPVLGGQNIRCIANGGKKHRPGLVFIGLTICKLQDSKKKIAPKYDLKHCIRLDLNSHYVLESLLAKKRRCLFVQRRCDTWFSNQLQIHQPLQSTPNLSGDSKWDHRMQMAILHCQECLGQVSTSPNTRVKLQTPRELKKISIYNMYMYDIMQKNSLNVLLTCWINPIGQLPAYLPELWNWKQACVVFVCVCVCALAGDWGAVFRSYSTH